MPDTHVVTNQVPPLEDCNPATSPVLVEALIREGGQWGLEEVTELGAISASREALRWGELADRNQPVLHTHDQYGHRVDEVEYDPAYHELMRTAMCTSFRPIRRASRCWKCSTFSSSARRKLGVDLAALGPGSPLYWHVLVEAKKLAYADLYAFNADPQFEQIPLAKLISKSYAAEQCRRIDPRLARYPSLSAIPLGGTVYLSPPTAGATWCRSYSASTRPWLRNHGAGLWLRAERPRRCSSRLGRAWRVTAGQLFSLRPRTRHR